MAWFGLIVAGLLEGFRASALKRGIAARSLAWGLVVSMAGLHLAGCAPAPAQPPSATPREALAPAPHPFATPHAFGVHGMLLFGHDAIYASHLPLYHPPHDAQVVLRLEAEDRDAAAMIRAEIARHGLVTLVPEPFDLARLHPSAASPLREITGAVYRGHFERGGVVVQAGVRLRVAAIVVHRVVHEDAPPAGPRWIAFGSGREGYLLHVIGRRPDVDTIVAVEGALPAEAATLEAREDGALLPSAAWLAEHGLGGARVIYREEDDLR